MQRSAIRHTFDYWNESEQKDAEQEIYRGRRHRINPNDDSKIIDYTDDSHDFPSIPIDIGVRGRQTEHTIVKLDQIAFANEPYSPVIPISPSPIILIPKPGKQKCRVGQNLLVTLPSQQLRLFDPVLVEDFAEAADINADVESIREKVSTWAVGEPSNLGELTLEQAFNNDIFGEILGYRLARPGRESFQFLPKEQAETGSGFPDFLIGHFGHVDGELDPDHRVAVGELKDPNTDLDSGAGSGEGIRSPVEQAFNYSNKNGLGLRWVIVSNMDEIRLYHQGSIQHYEQWEFEDFIEDGELTNEFWRFYHLMNKKTLLGEKGESSKAEELFERDLSERLELTENFYEFYREAVKDVYDELSDEYPGRAAEAEGRIDLIRSSQKLMHRAIIICIFSDRSLLPRNILPEVLDSGRNAPTMREGTIYSYLKDLFRAVDTGSNENYPYDVFGYDGGLFSEDQILSNAKLSDSLFNQEYNVGDDRINGIFGFHVYDFRDDLNEFVLGRIFEESITDFEQIHESILEGDEPFSEADAREDYGIYFTREGLTEFVADGVMEDIFQDKRREVRERFDGEADEPEDYAESSDFLREYLSELLNIRIADLSCGSGAFLVSCFSQIQQEAEAVHDKLVGARSDRQTELTFEAFETHEREIIEKCIHGNDLLQEAVEISKLSVWIRSAKEEVSLGRLTGNFTAEDALSEEIIFDEGDGERSFDDFDLIIGNPPWGGDVSGEAEEWMEENLDGFMTDDLDTYELFILVGLKYLKSGGRLAFVLPQTILRSEHESIRTHLLNQFTFERFHVMGADWFGSDIRMNTVTLQLKNETPESENTFGSMSLVDEDRRQAISGNLSLTQLESAYSFPIPQDRCAETGEIEPFRYLEDDDLIEKMESRSIPMEAMCSSTRGMELNRDGYVIKCPGCMVWTKPPRGRDPETKKTCNECGHEFEYQNRLADAYLVKDDPADADIPYLSGSAQGGRYEEPELKGLDLGYEGVDYKSEELYSGDTLYIREAGVGLSVSYFGKTVWCPRSVYVFSIRESRGEIVCSYETDSRWTSPENVPEGLNTQQYHKFLLGVLNSRIMHYYVFKRFSSIDAAQAFANMRMTDVRSLPVPVEKIGTSEGRELVAEIASDVDELLDQGDIGGSADRRIEESLRRLYGLSNDDMAYLHKQMGLVGYHQSMQQLYPEGLPPKPERKELISLTDE